MVKIRPRYICGNCGRGWVWKATDHCNYCKREARKAREEIKGEKSTPVDPKTSEIPF